MLQDIDQANQWYATNAVKMFRDMGWAGKVRQVRLVHPEGRNRFETSGAVFIYGYPNEHSYFSYLCALFPNQSLKMHHHEERVEVFSVLWGTVYRVSVNGAQLMAVGDFLESRIGEKHGLSTDEKGGLLVGVCHVNHLCDTYWEKDPLSCHGGDGGIQPPPSEYTIVTLNEQQSPFDMTLHNTMKKYKEVNHRMLVIEDMIKLRKYIDKVIPLYKNGDREPDVVITAKAAMAGKLEFLKWCMKTYGKHVFNEQALSYAIKGGAKDVAEWLLDEGIAILDASLMEAARHLGINQKVFIF